MDATNCGDWYWDVARQVTVRLDNAGRHDLLIGPYLTRRDAEVWLPSGEWTQTRASDSGDDWVDVNSAYD